MTDINGWILFGSIAFGVVTFFLGFYLGANVRRSLDSVANGADGDCEPSVRAETDKTPENGGQEH